MVLILCRFVSDNDQASQPYSRVGKQYVLTKCNAEISFDCLPITDIMFLNWPYNFLHTSDTSVAPELHRKCTPRYFTLVAQGIGLSHMDNIYRQKHCAKRKLPVINLLRGRFWGFSSRRGDRLHRWGWNLARRRGPPFLPNFTPSVQRHGCRTPKT